MPRTRSARQVPGGSTITLVMTLIMASVVFMAGAANAQRVFLSNVGTCVSGTDFLSDATATPILASISTNLKAARALADPTSLKPLGLTVTNGVITTAPPAAQWLDSNLNFTWVIFS